MKEKDREFGKSTVWLCGNSISSTSRMIFQGWEWVNLYNEDKKTFLKMRRPPWYNNENFALPGKDVHVQLLRMYT